MAVKIIPKETLIELFSRPEDWVWEPDACPYPNGNVKTCLEPFDPMSVMAIRREENREYWSNEKKRRYDRFRPFGYEMMLDKLAGFINRYADSRLYIAYQPQGHVFLPLTEADERGVGIASDHFHSYELIVEDRTRRSVHQPSFRPVLLVKFAFIADEMWHTGYHKEDGGPHGQKLTFKWEQAFETLFDILVIDPRKRIALHWTRDDQGRFPKTAIHVGERDTIGLTELGLNLSLSENVLFYGSVDGYEKRMREDEQKGRVRITFPEYPVPDFYHIERVYIFANGVKQVDLGQSDGPMKDGRMWHKEVTATADGKIIQTYFFSKIGIEALSAEALFDLVKSSHTSFEHDPEMPVQVNSVEDRQGHLLWVVQICAIDGERRYTERYPYYWPYDPTLPTYSWPDLINRYSNAQNRGAAYLLLCQDTWDAAKQDPDLGYYITEVDGAAAAVSKLQELDLGDYHGAGRDRCIAVIDASDPNQPFNEGIYHPAKDWLSSLDRSEKL